MKTRLLHVRANVSNLEKSRKWYVEVLGFVVTGAWPLDKPNYIHFDTDEGAIFSIMEDKDFPSYGRFNFSVKDVDVLWEELRNKVKVVEALFDTPYGTRKFTILDPDGNELGFVIIDNSKKADSSQHRIHASGHMPLGFSPNRKGYEGEKVLILICRCTKNQKDSSIVYCHAARLRTILLSLWNIRPIQKWGIYRCLVFN
jgi:catechol 2,3-dioxygenase-like lactoylglutathione lyase family enzyme